MNLFKRFFRNEELAAVSGVEVWSVRWRAIDGRILSDSYYSHINEPVAEFFTSKKDAERFAKALEDAFKLTRNTLDWYEIRKESIQ